MRDPLVKLDPERDLKHQYKAFADSLPESVLQLLAVEARAATSLHALLAVATRCAELYVQPRFWNVGMIAQAPAEVESLARLARTAKPRVICEIGLCVLLPTGRLRKATPLPCLLARRCPIYTQGCGHSRTDM